MKNKLFVLTCVVFIFLLMACTSLTTSPENLFFTEVKETEAADIRIFEYLENKIIFNIANGLDIEEDIDFKQIKVFMNNYKLQPDSKIVKVNNKPFDALVIQDLQKLLTTIQVYWENDKKDKIHRIANEYFNDNKNLKYAEEYSLSDAITYYSYQAENSQDFFLYLTDQFQLPCGKYNLDKLPEIYLQDFKLPMSVIIMDNIPLEATAAEVIYSIIKKEANHLMQNINNELIEIINKNYNICASNAKNYVTWYYSVGAQPKKLIKQLEGWINKEKTGNEVLGEFVIGKYTELIGKGTTFENITKKWQQYNEIAEKYSSVFLQMIDNSYYQYNMPVIVNEISADSYMLPLSNLINYLHVIGYDGIQHMSMGNKFDADSVPVLDIINTLACIGVGFIPYAGIPLEILVEILFLKIRKKLKRSDFEREIISSMRNEQMKLINIISLTNYGGRYEN